MNKSKKQNLDVLLKDCTWDQIDSDLTIDPEDELNPEGSKTLVFRKRQQTNSLSDVEERPGIEYPEIVWYLISKFIRPEDVGRFAGINHVTYSLTKTEYFWRTLYNRYCAKHPKLPEQLKLENGYRVYGLRQRVIRALYHTYKVFLDRIGKLNSYDSKPHELVKRRCVNMWYSKETTWSFYFKFKKTSNFQRIKSKNFIEELGNIDANPENDSQILQVNIYFILTNIYNLNISTTSWIVLVVC